MVLSAQTVAFWTGTLWDTNTSQEQLCQSPGREL
jgi:hypothetical protein